MCGVWGCLGHPSWTIDSSDVIACVKTLIPRGPEEIRYDSPMKKLLFGFTRLALNGVAPVEGALASQPIQQGYWTILCNGELYNHAQLTEEFKWKIPAGSSDCAILPYLLSTVSTTHACRSLDGVFAILAHDAASNTLLVARDPFGVRPLFEGITKDGAKMWASELKALIHCSSVKPFPPGTWKKYDCTTYECIASEQYYTIPTEKQLSCREETTASAGLRRALEEAVQKRVQMSERPVGALLSGGLDSSLVAALAAKYLPTKLHTFSIGMPGSTDLLYAKQVAEHIGSIHHEIMLEAKDFLEAIPHVIKATETYDITSVRASVGNWLVGKWICEHTDIKVVLNGDGSDEVGGGYLYFYRAPTEEEFESECRRLLEEIHLFDVLRSDRCISCHGLEPRTPFLDKRVVGTWLRSSTVLRRPVKGFRVEKELLRNAFAKTGLLPEAVLWRRKEAFSDGVSSTHDSWYSKIQEHVKSLSLPSVVTSHNPPTSEESNWYRTIFNDLYGDKKATVIPHMWLPKWSGETTDPSARTLTLY
jgi:asparagine synthase (glutamine-hydrolysing)